jgi:hypothetical protein
MSVNAPERKSADRLAYEHYLRTGVRLTTSEWIELSESKFNPNHDELGRFTFGSAGAGLGEHGRRHLAVGRGQRAHRPMTDQAVEAHATHAMSQYREELARGKSPEEAAAWAANSEAESGGDPSKHQDGGGPGRGRFQWGSPKPAFDRSATFERVMKKPVDQASTDEQFAFRDWELQNTHKSTQRNVDAAKTVGDKSRAITIHYLAPAHKLLVAEDRARIAEAIYRRAKATKPK